MKTYSTRQLQLNISKALEDLPFAIVKYGRIIAIVNEPSFEVGLNKETGELKEVSIMTHPIPNGNKAMQDFMAKNTMVKTSEAVQKNEVIEIATTDEPQVGTPCGVLTCWDDAVAQGIWVEFDFETGERTAKLWLCQKHLEIGSKNSNG